MENQARASVKHEPAEGALSGQPEQQAQPQQSSSSRRTSLTDSVHSNAPHTQPKAKSRRNRNDASEDSSKRRCISTACVACRKRKSKCDGNTPSCAACASVYGTPCVYDPNSDHRRKGVYKKDIDSLKTRESTLQILVSAILNYPQDEVPDLVRQIRACESLEKVADAIVARENGDDTQLMDITSTSPSTDHDTPAFERQLYSKVGELRLEDGSVRFIGGTSNLLYDDADIQDVHDDLVPARTTQSREQVIRSWTTVDASSDMIVHLLNLYFTWHYPFFTLLSQTSFWRDFNRGNPERQRKTEYCSPLLVNVMLALGCHFSSMPSARASSDQLASAGDHFFQEAKRLIDEGDEYAKPRITTVQALALMSVREAGCGREAKGWVYSGIAFRMACDLGINFETDGLIDKESNVDEEEEDVRRVTFWGCFLIDKCWSNYLGRLPLFQASDNITMPKFNVFPEEDAETWTPYTDSGHLKAHSQPSRVRAVALQLSALCDISGDLMRYFYHPQDKHPSRQAELKRLEEIHTRLETWRRNLPKEMDAHEGSLPSVLVMHMLFQLLHIHLFRPFLKYSPTNSPLPSHVSPRKLCTNAAGTISKLLRLYKRSYGLRQICNIAVYIAHSACTIHLLNLPDKNAARDISHGVRHLEEIADCWLCARRTLRVLSSQARKWQIDLPDDAAQTLARTDAKYGHVGSPKSSFASERALQTHQAPSILANQSLPLQSPWSSRFSDGGRSLASSLNMPLGAATSTPATQQYSPQDASFVVLPGSLQGSSQMQSSDQSNAMQQTPDVHASYLNLLQQQQAWSEAAARNGIPAVPTFGQPGIPQTTPTSSVFDGSNNAIENGVFPVAAPQLLPAADNISSNSGQIYPQSQARITHQSPQSDPVTLTQSSAQVASEAVPTLQIPGRRRRSTSIDQDALSPLQPLQSRKQQQQPQTGNRRGSDDAASRQCSMFGGVEALLREAHDWWVDEGTQFASGFSNWHSSRRNSAARGASATGGGPTAADGGQQQQQQANTEHNDADDPATGRTMALDLSSLGSAGGNQAARYDHADWFS